MTTLKNTLQHCDFSNPEAVYLMVMLPRKKENKNHTDKDKLKMSQRLIVSCRDDVERALEQFEATAAANPDVVYRVYVTVNRRSLVKGFFAMQKYMNDLTYQLVMNPEGNDQNWEEVKRLSSTFKSLLAKPNCRYDKMFMYDVDFPNDTPEGQLAAKLFRNAVAQHTNCKLLESKNCYALLCQPFNPKLVTCPEDVELKTDALLYVGCLNDGE